MQHLLECDTYPLQIMNYVIKKNYGFFVISLFQSLFLSIDNIG